MSTSSSTDIRADLQSLCESIALKRPIDSAISRRIQQQADRVRDELRQHGYTDMADQLLQDSRDE